VNEQALPPEAFGSALAGLPGMGPARLSALLGRWHPYAAWQSVLENRAHTDHGLAAACRPNPAALGVQWARAARKVDVRALWLKHREAGVAVHVIGGESYPKELCEDPDAPGVIFSMGDCQALSGRRVAVIGTRRCTQYGRDVARELGRDLAAAGVRIVSGLALGIDGAAHSGALAAEAAPPVAIVGSGLDVVYPGRHRDLWKRVADIGLIISEAPLGAPPEPWRFPARNRIIACLAELVVVVESPFRGGSKHTVDAAEARGVQVMAVPGPVRSPMSSFPNDLIAQGCAPARDALDVLVALGLSSARGRGDGDQAPDTRPPPTGDGAAVLAALGWEPASLEQLVARTRLGPAKTSIAVARLERDGWVTSRSGWWTRLAATLGP